jgi:hypothetical protein
MYKGILDPQGPCVLHGEIQTIRAVLNPDKLRHLGPVADAWAVTREANKARRAAGHAGDAACPVCAGCTMACSTAPSATP